MEKQSKIQMHNSEADNKKLLMLKKYILENTSNRIIERYSSLENCAHSTNFGNLDKDVVVVDTETTGFSFNHDHLIQIAAARMEQGKITGWYNTFVNPGKPIPDDIVHLTHICDKDVEEAPTPNEALSGLVKFVGDSPLVAHNAQFDYTFCTKYPAGEQLKHNLWFDSLDLARIVLPRFNSHRLLDLIRAFSGPESTHRADDDVAATCIVYRILLAGISFMPKDLVSYIAELAPVEEWNTGYIFKEFSKEQVEPYNFKASRKAAVSKNLGNLRRDAFSPNIEDLELDNNTQEKSNTSINEPKSFLEFPTNQEIKDAFSNEGLIGSLYDNFEPRSEQVEMAIAVNKALRTSNNLAVEAGTGVGKSMAYLVPLSLTAKKNSITVGIATKTNALLDQLVNKELPLLQKSLGISFTSLKGFTHYLCNRKIDQIVHDGAKKIVVKNQEIHQAPALAALLSFIEQTEYDDIDGLKIDYKAFPRYSITTKSNECLRRKCPFFGRSCYVHGAREQAQRSDVVVTNHSLLFWDVKFEGGLLPPIRYWVVDEAHGAEQEARRAFSVELSSTSIQNLIKRVSSDSPRYNALLRAERANDVEDEGKTLFLTLTAKAHTAAGAFAIAAQEYVLRVKDLLYFSPTQKSKGYENFDLWLNDEIRNSSIFTGVAQTALSMQKTLDKLIACLRDIVAFYESADIKSSVQREIALLALELRELYEAIEQIFIIKSDNKVYSVRMTKGKDKLYEVFTVQPLNVGSDLNETLYNETHSVIYTSATLAVDHRFEAFERSVGLNLSEASKGDVLQVDSSYDFDNHMRIYVPNNLPEPNSPAYLVKLQEFLIDLHKAQNGSLLTLFTNRKEMENCFDVVNPAIKSNDLRLVCQKWGVSVKGLRDDFLKDEKLSLFALKSFWEGFDAPGSTLRGVVVTKLPFGLPTDPLSCERANRDNRAWVNYSLPDAVIEVKQAVGRLIRTSTDEGIVVLTDHRLISKYYGKKFLNSLPSNNISIISTDEIIAEISRNNEECGRNA